MGRIAEDLIARIKAEVPLERLLAAGGVELVRRGKDLVARCPFHDDSEPSLVVTPGKGLWRCFGCGKGGSAIDWRMELSGESFRAAVESLATAYLPGAVLEETSPAAAPAGEPFSAEEVQAWLAAGDVELLQRVAGYYRERLDVDPRGREYLASRGLLDEATIEGFGLGLADRTLGLRLPPKQAKAGETLRGRLQQLGILRADSGHEHLNGSLVVPIRDLDGRIVQMYGRKVTPNLRKGTPLHLYLPGSCNCVFHPEALVESDEVILCESILDALTFWSAGFLHVTCAFGTQGFTDALHAALLAHGTRRVLVAYDRDDAGDRAAEELGKKLLAEGIECYRVQFPRGMDASEYAQKVQPAGKSLDLVLRRAEWMGTGPPPKRQRPEPPAPAEELDLSEPAASSLAAPSSAASAVVSPADLPDTAPAAAPGSVLPAAPASAVPIEVREQEVVLSIGDRRYRVRGLDKNLSYDSLRVNLLAARGDGFHVDTLDLYAARQRGSFAKQAATELAIEAKLAQQDLGKVLLALERLQDERIAQALAPAAKEVAMSVEERREALELLTDPRLVERIAEDFERCGVVGEDSNKLLVYLAAVSRKLERPLAVMVQSSSAAGKSALMEAALAFVPEEERVAYSAMTGQSLFYMGEKDLAHKVLAIAEEEGAGRASYALKLFQSEGRVSIASTGKDPATGRLVTHEYTVQGPAAILTTTTAIDLDEEFLNRCLVLSVDEGREQTEQIHRLQRKAETLEGLLARADRDAVLRRHQNAQRLLEPLAVVNPFAEELSYPSTSTRTRRDHTKYLALIRAIALLHQHQRPIRTAERDGRPLRYVEATLADVELANRLAHEVLGRTLDELPSQTQRLLAAIHGMVEEACTRLAMEQADYRFSRREVRERTGWGNTQLKMHLSRLEELEYLLVHRGSRGQSYVYELLYGGEGEQRERFMMGLLDVERLEGSGYDGKRSGSLAEKSGINGKESGPSRARVGVESGGGREALVPMLPVTYPANGDFVGARAHREAHANGASYPERRRSAAPAAALAGKG